jgi:hypothetical protein
MMVSFNILSTVHADCAPLPQTELGQTSSAEAAEQVPWGGSQGFPGGFLGSSLAKSVLVTSLYEAKYD